MTSNCTVRISRDHYEKLFTHLFPGDDDEHGAVILAGISNPSGNPVLSVREVHLAREGTDYVAGRIGYRALSPQYIHRFITRARDEKLVYLAVHNHFSDLSVGFSRIDLDSHELGYPALLQISKGMPVGAIVCGRRSMQADLWMSRENRVSLDKTIIVGSTISELRPSYSYNNLEPDERRERQIRMFGKTGQEKLKTSRVAIVGLGGIGSLLVEYLSRLGVGKLLLVDDDVVEKSNLSRIVGATWQDADKKVRKTEIAKRVASEANDSVEVELVPDDVAKDSVARRLASCDFIFLAADSMRARLIFNSVVHQYLVPGAQLGSKIRSDSQGTLVDVMSANRPVRPGKGCLWCNQLIDPTQLAKEAKTDAERKDQAYGVLEPNPSVITLNAISAAHAVNDFLLDYLGLRRESELHYEHFHFLTNKRSLVRPARDLDCSECSPTGLRFGRGDGVPLPSSQG